MTGETLNKTVAERVEAAYKAAGTDPTRLAMAAGIPRSTLLHRLAGHYPFDVEQLDKIANALGVDVWTFVERDAA